MPLFLPVNACTSDGKQIADKAQHNASGTWRRLHLPFPPRVYPLALPLGKLRLPAKSGSSALFFDFE
jgi:hypothetical protein